MKFRMFTSDGAKVAVNVDEVESFGEERSSGKTIIVFKSDKVKPPPEIAIPGCDGLLRVDEDFQTVFSRLNTIAE